MTLRQWFGGVILALALTLPVAACGGSGKPTASVSRAGALHQPGAPVVRPRTVFVSPPRGADRESRADGVVRAGGAACGRERWDVKTATDPAAANIDLTVRQTTVAALDAVPTTNPGNPDQPRDAGAESTVYAVTATLDAVKQEADGDFHLALSDGQGHSMIAEIPNAPACTEPPITARVSYLETQIEGARTAFIREFGTPTSTSFTPIGRQVTIAGVGFFDVLHGQRNVAPNGIELHPVIAISDP